MRLEEVSPVMDVQSIGVTGEVEANDSSAVVEEESMVVTSLLGESVSEHELHLLTREEERSVKEAEVDADRSSCLSRAAVGLRVWVEGESRESLSLFSISS